MSDLKTLFSNDVNFVELNIAGESHTVTIREITIESLVDIEDLAKTVEQLQIPVGGMTYTAFAIASHLVVDVKTKSKLFRLLEMLTDIPPSLFPALTLEQLVLISVKVIEHNKQLFEKPSNANSQKKTTWADVIGVMVEHGFSMSELRTMTLKQINAHLDSIIKRNSTNESK